MSLSLYPSSSMTTFASQRQPEMLAATNPMFRGFMCRSPRQACRSAARGSYVSVDDCENDRLTGSWFVVAGYARATIRHEFGEGRLTIVRAERRRLRSRILDRFAGRDRYRVLWQDDERGHCVIARSDRSRVWILSRSPGMQTRELFQQVAELRRLGFDTRPLQYANVA